MRSSSRGQQQGRKPDVKGPPLLTDRTPCEEVRLVDDEGNRIVSKAEALALGESSGLDLILMNPDSDPPVVRLMDYGKFKFEADKKAREAKKRQHTVTVKEIKFGIRIDDHDYDVKLGRAKKFLAEGNKVKCSIRLRGREVQHSQLAFQLAERFAADLEADGNLESPIRQESFRQITLGFAPKK